MHKVKDQRSRFSRPTTIHGFAQYGDLIAFQKLLRDNHSLLNDRNPVMAQTPLHVSAGYNNVEIMIFLLDWPGAEKVELEAKNMYGETPLHMAAKNGCNEAVKMLLARGAFVEAKANNGMTPLHLAVWHSLRSKDYSTVKTLLEYDADGSTEDNAKEVRNCVNYSISILKSSGNVELSKHAVRRKPRWMRLKMNYQTLWAYIHLNYNYGNGQKGCSTQLLQLSRRALSLKVGPRRPPHMAFLGNPGTGKTMVARILGKLLHVVGILPTDRVTEVQRTDLVGEFVGHTGPKTRRKIQEGEGGILFVDEAYRLIPTQKADDKDYGLEALEEIMSVMDSGKIVVIFAGYSEPMKRVISSNEGFNRRVTKFFHFDDFSSEDLAEILHLKMSKQDESSLLYGFKLHPSCSVDAIAEVIERETSEKQRKEMNGGLVDPMLVNARESLDLRLNFDCIDSDDLLMITLEDLQAGLRLLKR